MSSAVRQALRLAVFIPVLFGDVGRAGSVFGGRLQSNDCPLQESLDLYFYLGPGSGEAQHVFGNALDNLTKGVGSCFGNITTVHAHLDEKVGVGPVLNDNQANENVTGFAHGGGGSPTTAAAATTTTSLAAASATPPAPSPTAILRGDHLSSYDRGERRQPRKCGRKKARHGGKASAAKWRLGCTNRRTSEEHDVLEERGGGSMLPDCRCYEGCVYTSLDGTKSRVCDPSCETGYSHGTKGCGAREGRYGEDCRVCYNDVARAKEKDSGDGRIMWESLDLVEADSGGGNIGHKWPKQERWREERKYGCLV